MGNLAFYVVLKGSVKPLSTPHVNKHYMRLRVTTPEPVEPAKEVVYYFENIGYLIEIA